MSPPTDHTHLTVFRDYTEEVFVHEAIVKLDNGGMVQLQRREGSITSRSPQRRFSKAHVHVGCAARYNIEYECASKFTSIVFIHRAVPLVGVATLGVTYL